MLQFIVCPICGGTDFLLETAIRNQREIREGSLACNSCQNSFPIHKGIVDLMPNPDQTIRDEQQGWRELLGETSEALVDTMLQLPHYGEDSMWTAVAENFDAILQEVDVRGKSVLDIGAGRCWSTRHLVNAGAAFAVGLDIITQRFIGLETADIYLEHDDIYFERMVGDMNNLPLRPNSFDIVFMTATLHHTSDPALAMRQVGKVLKPGGCAILINEPVRGIRQNNLLDGCVEIEHGINENVYSLREYFQAARSGHLNPTIVLPATIKKELAHNPNQTVHRFGRLGRYVLLPLWRREWGQNLISNHLLPLLYLTARMPLSMIAYKQ